MNQAQHSTKKEHLRKSNQESKTLTRHYIKTAFLYLIKETPYEKITVTAIIHRAGISRAGFYRNYPSKEAVLEDIADNIYQTISDAYLNNMDCEDPYHRYLSLFQQLDEHTEWFQLFTKIGEYNQHIFNLTPYLKHYLKPQTTEEHYRYIAIAHSQRAIILDWLENGKAQSPEEMACIFCHLYKNTPIL